MPLLILAAVRGVIMLSVLAGHLLAVLEQTTHLDAAMVVLVVHLAMVITEAQVESRAEVGAAVPEELQAHISVD